MEQNEYHFELNHVLEELKHHLPSQNPLKDFIHHNTLHAFQDHKFHDAMAKASTIFGYKTYLSFSEYQNYYTKGIIDPYFLAYFLKESFPKENITQLLETLLSRNEELKQQQKIGSVRNYWKEKYKIDLDARVHPLLFRILSNYLDQGIAIWNFPGYADDFFKSIRKIEKNSVIGVFKSNRVKRLLQSPKLRIEKLLHILVGDEQLFEAYLFDQQFRHPGWSGMVAVIEENPNVLLDNRSISLIDLIKFELLLEIDSLDQVFGGIWAPLGTQIKKTPKSYFEIEKKSTDFAFKQVWQNALEWSYFDQVLSGIQKQNKKEKTNLSPSFQSVFCIDDRECSIRRYVEEVAPDSQTFGTAGHFNLDFYFQPENGKFFTKVCPVPVNPKFLIIEQHNKTKKKKDFHFNKQSHSLLIGWLLTHTIGLWSGVRLALSIFRPRLSPSTSSSSMHMDPNAELTIQHLGEFERESGLQIGYTFQQMADRVEGLLKSIGLVSHFSPTVYIIGHGSTSVNNTHYAGYDCGACSGRPGSVNARVFAHIANIQEVRELLAKRGIVIPSETAFVGGLHDTSRDELTFFDLEAKSNEIKEKHLENVKLFEKALKKNAKERSRRFESINTLNREEKVHHQVKLRTYSLFEPRPELNHATNALAIVGRRSFTRGVFLDRRSFLNSYDYRLDQNGDLLLGILNAVAPVCGGINLEYYFSKVDNNHFGAGTKLPHNVMGLLGVSNGTDGDLRTGLPSQMVEVHDPLRLMVIVEQNEQLVLEVIKRNPQTYEWFKNEWIHLAVINPENQQCFVFKNGAFEVYEPYTKEIPSTNSIEKILEKESDNVPVMLIEE